MPHGPGPMPPGPSGRPPTVRFVVIALVLALVPLLPAAAGLGVALTSAEGSDRLEASPRPDPALAAAVDYPEPPGFERMDASVPGRTFYRKSGARIVVWLFEADTPIETLRGRLREAGITVDTQLTSVGRTGVASWSTTTASTEAREGWLALGISDDFTAAVVVLGRSDEERKTAAGAAAVVCTGMGPR